MHRVSEDTESAANSRMSFGSRPSNISDEMTKRAYILDSWALPALSDRCQAGAVNAR